MKQSFKEFLTEAKNSSKKWIKSQVIMSTITLVLLLVGLFVVDYFFVNVGNVVGIVFIALGIAIADLVPIIGISTCMLPWAAIAAIQGKTKLGLCIFAVFIAVMIIKEVLEPLIRGKTLGMSPLEEIISSVLGYLVLGMNPLGFIIGPVTYIVFKKVIIKIKTNKSFEANSKNEGFFNFKRRDESTKYEDVIDISDDVEEVNGDDVK